MTLQEAWDAAEAAADAWAGPLARAYVVLFRTHETDGVPRYAAEVDWTARIRPENEPAATGHEETFNNEPTPVEALVALTAEVIARTRQCDYCAEGLMLTRRGWHLRPDPEGVEGTAKIPCARMDQYPDEQMMDA